MDLEQKKRCIKETRLFIDGCFVEATSGKLFPTFDPSTTECLAQISEGDEEDVNLAVQAARKAFDDGPWPRLPGAARGRILYKFADLMEENVDELATLESLNNGLPLTISKGIVVTSAQMLRYTAGWADKITGKTIKMDGAFHGYTLSEPIGVVGAIVPWNFPIYMFVCKAGSALVCGNTVVVKPAEQTPLTALLLAKISLEAGVPPGVLNVVPGYGPTAGASIAKHMDVDKVSFTGSTEIGRLIMEYAAKSNLKPVTLELGGKSPFIICEDADLDAAVEVSHQAIFFHQGQVCMATSRVFVHENIYEQYLEKAVARAAKRVIGDPFVDGVEHGPQISQEQLVKILNYIESGKEDGARMITGGNQIGTKGFYVEPTIFADVEDSMKIARDEIFGPVLAVWKFKTLDEVVKKANNTKYGLAAVVFTKDIDTANTLSRSIRAGLIHINTYFNKANLPFGGYKMSGVGRENGYEGLLPYLQTKSVLMPLKDSPWL